MTKPKEQIDSDALAKRLDTYIPGDIDIHFWMNPILLKLTERIEALEKEVEELKKK